MLKKQSPKVAIIMAVYAPNLNFLSDQIASFLSQTYKNWNLFIFIDGPEEYDFRQRGVASLRTLIPARFRRQVTIVSGLRVGSYWNFERGLSLALKSNADLFCFSDQDDIWSPNKLEIQVHKLLETSASVLHSDLMAIDEHGTVVTDSVWRDEGRVYPITSSLLFTRNMVTGCTMLFTRNLAEMALPFPPQFRDDGTYWHHDYWLAMLASQHDISKLISIPKPLVKYRKHSQNQIGYTPGVYFPRNIRQAVLDFRLRKELLKIARSRVSERANRMGSVSDWYLLRLTLQNAIRFYSFGQTRLALFLSFANIASRIQFGFSKFTTLYKVIRLGLRKGQIFLRTNLVNLNNGSLIDSHRPGRASVVTSNNKSRELIILLPTLQASSLFGGIATILNFANVATRSWKSVKLICTDTPLLDTQEKIKRWIVEELKWKNWPSRLSINSISELLVVGKFDALVATAWWTKPICERIKQQAGIEIPIVYFVQDFEPLFYDASEQYLNALSSYDNCDYVIVNTSLLAEYLKFQVPRMLKNYSILSPQLIHPISRIESLEPDVLNLFFYARPSVSRNLYHLGIRSLQKFLLSLPQSTKVALHLAGESIVSIPEFPGHTRVYTHGKLSRADYSKLLASTDIGLCLMASPHPSYPTLELKIHGAQSVTNSFSKFKTSQKLKGIVVVEPQIDNIVQGLEIAYENFITGKDSIAVDFSDLGQDLVTVVGQMNDFLLRKIET